MAALEQAAWFRANGITPREALQALGVAVPPGAGWDDVVLTCEAELVHIRDARDSLPRAAA